MDEKIATAEELSAMPKNDLRIYLNERLAIVSDITVIARESGININTLYSKIAKRHLEVQKRIVNAV